MKDLLAPIKARLEKAAPGPWLYRSDSSSEFAIECEECGNEFPEQGYSLRSTDKYEVLHGELYGMETLCQPNGEFIAHSRTDIEKLVRVVETQDEALRLISMRKEGFPEDNYRCIEMADEALAEARKILGP